MVKVIKGYGGEDGKKGKAFPRRRAFGEMQLQMHRELNCEARVCWL
jgi:hypothetical protein